MVLKVLGNWKYKPKACGNKSMIITFKRLSGAEELTLGLNEDDVAKVERFKASIINIEHPFKLDIEGVIRDMTVDDIPYIPELSDLYFELIVEYSKNTKVDTDTVKKPE